MCRPLIQGECINSDVNAPYECIYISDNNIDSICLDTTNYLCKTIQPGECKLQDSKICASYLGDKNLCLLMEPVALINVSLVCRPFSSTIIECRDQTDYRCTVLPQDGCIQTPDNFCQVIQRNDNFCQNSANQICE